MLIKSDVFHILLWSAREMMLFKWQISYFLQESHQFRDLFLMLFQSPFNIIESLPTVAPPTISYPNHSPVTPCTGKCELSSLSSPPWASGNPYSWHASSVWQLRAPWTQGTMNWSILVIWDISRTPSTLPLPPLGLASAPWILTFWMLFLSSPQLHLHNVLEVPPPPGIYVNA